MDISKELIADLRNKLQAPLTVITTLAEGKQPTDKAVALARRDLEAILTTLNSTGNE